MHLDNYIGCLGAFLTFKYGILLTCFKIICERFLSLKLSNIHVVRSAMFQYTTDIYIENELITSRFMMLSGCHYLNKYQTKSTRNNEHFHIFFK